MNNGRGLREPILVHPAEAYLVAGWRLHDWIFKAWLRRPQALLMNCQGLTIRPPVEAELGSVGKQPDKK
jgi:hypothetical protein